MNTLQEEITPVAMTTWFEVCSPARFEDNTFTITAPSNFIRDILEQRWLDKIKEIISQMFAVEITVIIQSAEEATQTPVKPAPKSDADFFDRFTFDNFVVGSSNKFAHAAALAVATEQTKDYNPLFIYGESGLGKTHLIHAIRHEIEKRHPEFDILYVKGEAFMNEIINATQTGRTKTEEFRDKYRYRDLFIVDDIQIIGGKDSTQEEFFNTFNAIFEAGNQIIFTSDRPPKEMLTLTDRLKSRFESGLVADIQPPDYETRMAIIKNKATQLGVVLSDEIMHYIAEHITVNVRQIEGAVKKVMAYKEIMDDNLTISNVAKVLKDMFKEKTAFIPTPDIIIEETGKYYSIDAEDIKGQSRTRNTALARQVSMYLIRKITNLSLKDIGDLYEGRDHTTVMSSLKRVEKMMSGNPEFNQTIRDITSNINNRE